MYHQYLQLWFPLRFMRIYNKIPWILKNKIKMSGSDDEYEKMLSAI